MIWKQTRTEPHEKWESDCGNYDILHKPGSSIYMLVSFIHDPNEENQEYWRRPFKTLKEAKNYAELI